MDNLTKGIKLLESKMRFIESVIDEIDVVGGVDDLIEAVDLYIPVDAQLLIRSRRK